MNSYAATSGGVVVPQYCPAAAVDQQYVAGDEPAATRRSCRRVCVQSVANKPATAAPITAAVLHPMILRPGERVKRPITRRFDASSIITRMIGAAITPLITADQNSALIGSTGRKLRIVPSTVAITSVA